MTIDNQSRRDFVELLATGKDERAYALLRELAGDFFWIVDPVREAIALELDSLLTSFELHDLGVTAHRKMFLGPTDKRTPWLPMPQGVSKIVWLIGEYLVNSEVGISGVAIFPPNTPCEMGESSWAGLFDNCGGARDLVTFSLYLSDIDDDRIGSNLRKWIQAPMALKDNLPLTVALAAVESIFIPQVRLWTQQLKAIPPLGEFQFSLKFSRDGLTADLL
jgi:hypothetical protein